MSEILIFGDICPRWGNGNQFDSGNPEIVFHDILPLIKQADFVTGNLEAPATDSTTLLAKTSMNLKCKPSDLNLLRLAGFSALSLANNHILDFGTEGLRETIRFANETHLSTYGAGNLSEASMPFFITIEDRTIGFLSFAEHEFNCAVDYDIGANLWDDLSGIQLIREVRKQCDYLIVQYHGGIEEYELPSPRLQKKCRAMVDAGATIVTCQHSHCIGTYEVWKGGHIIYGQGNSVFGYEKGNKKWNQGLIIKARFTDKCELEFMPISAYEDGVHLLHGDDAAAILHRIEDTREKLNDEGWIKESWVSFCKAHEDSYLPLQLGWGKLFTKLNKILHGKLVKVAIQRKQSRTVMNLVRCDAHREVVTTILENSL